MKKVLFFFAMLAIATGMKAQTFYETSFVNPNDNETYIGLMIFYSDEECKMRFVNNQMLQEDRVAEVAYALGQEDKQDAEDVGVMCFVPEDRDQFPVFVWTWQAADGSDISEVPVIMLGEQTFQAEYFKEITLNDMDAEYIGQFYGEKEPEYQLLINGVQTVRENGTEEEPAIESAESFYGNATDKDDDTPTMHLIFVANTTVSDIGAACERDVKNVSSEFQGIAKALKMNFKEYDVNGKNYSVSSVGQTISDVTPGKNDVVMFVYTGHGFRFDNQKSKYPCMDLRSSQYDDIENNYAAMSDIYKLITAKGARLNIILSDCCNSKIGENSPIINNNTLLSRSNNNFDIKRLRSLFLGSEGTIWATAASPGEYSWCGTTGGYFLNSIIESLRKQISPLNTAEPSWDVLVNEAISSAAQKTSCNADTQAQNGVKTVNAKTVKF